MRKMLVPGLVAALFVSGVAWAGATISIDSMEVDGVRIRDLNCDLSSGGGLMGGMVVASTLASQKQALDACAPDGGAYKAEWTWTAGETTVDKVEGTPSAGADCVKKALSNMESGSTGTCRSAVLVGNPEKAEAHWKALSGAEEEPAGEGTE